MLWFSPKVISKSEWRSRSATAMVISGRPTRGWSGAVVGLFSVAAQGAARAVVAWAPPFSAADAADQAGSK